MASKGQNIGNKNHAIPENKENERRVRVTIRLPLWLVEWLRSNNNQGKMIEQALIGYYRINK